MSARTTRVIRADALLTACVCVLCVPAVATALPEGRAYEMVSPPYKGGYEVDGMLGTAVAGADEGDRVVFNSEGAFAGTPGSNAVTEYLAQRGADRWTTSPMAVPTDVLQGGGVNELTPTLEAALYDGGLGESLGQAEVANTEPEFLVHSLNAPDTAPAAPLPTPNFSLVGFPLKRLDGQRFSLSGAVAASPDLCHVVFNAYREQTLLPEALGTSSFLYELTAGRTVPGCGYAPPVLRLVGVGNMLGPNGEPEVLSASCVTYLGSSAAGGGEGTFHAFNAVSSDGTEIFFSADANRSALRCDGEFNEPKNPAILYVRLNGERTVGISTPRPADCEESDPCSTAVQARATFMGAGESGQRVFFATAQPLVSGDRDSGRDLYLATIGCPVAASDCTVAEREVTSLTQVSYDPNGGQAAEMQGVALVSAHGNRVYFVARGVLTGANAEGRAPVVGADNLYVYDAEEGSGGSTRFIADLCSGPGYSGEARDPQCSLDLQAGEGGRQARNDVGLWTSWPEWQTTGDGGYLVFASYGQLVADDANVVKDVYRYDATRGTLERVSNGEGNSNAVIPPLDENGQFVTDFEMNYRVVSEDGSRIAFETAESLSPQAVSGSVDVYEWHKRPGWTRGKVALVSSGTDREPVGGEPHEVVVTPSGRDIFFVSAQSLLPQDTDGARDIYDARLGGGFPSAPMPIQECYGETCEEPLANPASLLMPGSETQLSENAIRPSKQATKHHANPGRRRKRKTGRRTIKRSHPYARHLRERS